MGQGWIATKDEIGCSSRAGGCVLSCSIPSRPIASSPCGILEDVPERECCLHAKPQHCCVCSPSAMLHQALAAKTVQFKHVLEAGCRGATQQVSAVHVNCSSCNITQHRKTSNGQDNLAIRQVPDSASWRPLQGGKAPCAYLMRIFRTRA